MSDLPLWDALRRWWTNLTTVIADLASHRAKTHTAILIFGINGAITPNATQYLSPGAGPTAATPRWMKSGRSGTLKNLYVRQRVASGAAGRTDVYTVQLGGGDTALTVTLDNLVENWNTADTVACAPDNDISIKLISNNAADTSADCYATASLEFST